MRIRFFIALISAFLVFAPSYAQKSKSTLSSEITSQFPDNMTGAITPSILRSVTTDIVNSFQQYTSVNPQVGTSYTVQASDYGKLVTFNNGSSIAVSLPQASGSFSTFNFYVLNLGSGTVTITPTGSTINGASTLSVITNQSVWIISDGTNYQVWSGNQLTNTSVTGSGPVVLQTTPTISYPNITTPTITSANLITPTLGVASATSINRLTITAPASSATLTITNGQTLSYQEGSWTPALSGSSSGGWTLSTAVGSYEKVGRQVTARFSIIASAASSPVGNVTITGLPFTSSSSGSDNGVCSIQYIQTWTAAAGYVWPTGTITPGATTIGLSEGGTTKTMVSMAVGELNTTPTIIGVCNYHT